jgi:hypothetical protein
MRAPSRSRFSALAAAAAALLSLSGCMFQAVQGGSDTETFTGLLLTPEGKPAAGARVRLIPSDYDPTRPDSARIRVAVTDRRGRYTFPRTESAGSYNLLAAGNKAGALFREALSPDSLPDTLRLDTARVIRLGMYEDSFYTYEPGQAWFPGTDILVRCEADSAMVMDLVPRNLNNLVLEGSHGWRHDYTIEIPGDSLSIQANRFEVKCDALPW